MTFANPRAFKQALFRLQADTKTIRDQQFEQIRQELPEAVKVCDIRHIDMMQLLKAMWLYLYKEDKTERQFEIAEQIAKLIFSLPTQEEFFALYNLDDDGNPIDGDEYECFQDESDQILENEEEEYEEFEEYSENELMRLMTDETRQQAIEEGEECDEAEDEEEEEYITSRMPVHHGRRVSPKYSGKLYKFEESSTTEDERDFIDRQIEYGGFAKLFFTCALETFMRELPRVDYYRLSKFYYWIRQTLISSLSFAVQKKCLLDFMHVLDISVFNASMIDQHLCPQQLSQHILEIYNDVAREVIKTEGFDKQDLKMMYIPIASFLLRLDPGKHQQLIDVLIQQVFNDFTDCQYERDESLARFLQPSLEENQYEGKSKEDFPLQDICVFLSYQEGQLFNKGALLEFAEDLQEFYEYFNSEEYDQKQIRQYDEDGNRLRQADLDEIEHKKIISKEAIRKAKKNFGYKWRQHVYKLDGVIHYKKDNVLDRNYEDDYLPDEYKYLEAKQREISDHWDNEIDNDGFDTGEDERINELVKKYNGKTKSK